MSSFANVSLREKKVFLTDFPWNYRMALDFIDDGDILMSLQAAFEMRFYSKKLRK